MANGFNQNSLSAWAAEIERLRQAIREFQNTIEYQSKMREKGMENFFSFKESVEKGGTITDENLKELNKKHQNYISDQQRKTTAISNAQKGLAEALDAQKHAQKIYNQLFNNHTQKLKSLHAQVQDQLHAYNQAQQKQAQTQQLAARKQADAQKKQIQQNARKRRTVAKGLRSQFGSSRIAAAFMKNYIQPDGTMTIAGEKKAEQLRNQNQFISRLVKSLAGLPIFNKVGRAFQQLGIMTMMSGVSRFRQGGWNNQMLGAGQTLLGLGVYLAPAMASAFGTVMTNIVAKKIIEAVAIGTMKGNLGGGGGFGKYVGRGALGLSTAFAGYVGASDLWKRGDAYRASSNPRERIKGTQIGGFGNMTITAGILAGISALFGPVTLPLTLTMTAIAGATYLIGRNVDKIWKGVDTFVGWLVSFKSWLGNVLGKINPFGKGGRGTQPPSDYQASRFNPSYMSQSVDTNQLVQAVANKKVGKASTFTSGDFLIHQYGNSNFE